LRVGFASREHAVLGDDERTNDPVVADVLNFSKLAHFSAGQHSPGTAAIEG
jgi:hypothetical protein